MIKKKTYRKKDITAIGIAPALDGSLNTKTPSKFQGIYITFGRCNRGDFSDHGIVFVWTWVVLRRALPRTILRLGRITDSKFFHNNIRQEYIPPYMSSNLSQIQDFDGLLWMSYSEERLSFLKAWLGSRFYELTQTE